jgi:hypothetical protein
MARSPRTVSVKGGRADPVTRRSGSHTNSRFAGTRAATPASGHNQTFTAGNYVLARLHALRSVADLVPKPRPPRMVSRASAPLKLSEVYLGHTGR